MQSVLRFHIVNLLGVKLSVFLVGKWIILVSQHVDQVISIYFIGFHLFVDLFLIYLRVVFTADHRSYFSDDTFLDLLFVFRIFVDSFNNFEVAGFPLQFVVRWELLRRFLTILNFRYLFGVDLVFPFFPITFDAFLLPAQVIVQVFIGILFAFLDGLLMALTVLVKLLTAWSIILWITWLRTLKSPHCVEFVFINEYLWTFDAFNVTNKGTTDDIYHFDAAAIGPSCFRIFLGSSLFSAFVVFWHSLSVCI